MNFTARSDQRQRFLKAPFCHRALRSACNYEFDQAAKKGSLLLTKWEYNFFPVVPSSPLLHKGNLIQAAGYFHLSKTGPSQSSASLMDIMSSHMGKAKKSSFLDVLGPWHRGLADYNGLFVALTFL